MGATTTWRGLNVDARYAYYKVFDEKGPENAYFDIGLEPSWRFDAAGQKVGIALPIDWGLGANDYYLNSRGANATIPA